MTGPRAIALAVLTGLALWGAAASTARADAPTPGQVNDAAKHFQRGVTMYNEADYSAALVEFRRAYEIAPNVTVLYNIAQTYLQLQNYAAALVTFERYLKETGAGAPHRKEVEQTIETLQSRVGRVAITTTAPDCEITVDDELVGKTPLAEPVLVSIGRRKITAVQGGRPVDTRFVDVAAGDTVKLTLSAGDTGPRSTAPPPSAPAPRPSPASPARTGWIITGSLGAIALVAGGAAFFESRSLASARDTYNPNDTFATKHDELTSKGNWVSRLSLTADIAAVATVISAAITWKFLPSGPSETHVAISPGGVHVAGRF